MFSARYRERTDRGRKRERGIKEREKERVEFMIGRRTFWYGLGALLRPSDIEHFQVILHYTNFFLLMGLIEIFQNDRNIHIDDNHIANDNETSKVRYGQQGMTTISICLTIKVRITFWRLYH